MLVNPRIRSLRLLLFPFAVFMPLAACGGAEGDEAGDSSVIFAELGPEGGVLEWGGGAAAASDGAAVGGGGGELDGVRVELPAGALIGPARVTLAIAGAGLKPLPEGGVSVGPQVRVGPEELDLLRPLRVRLPFSSYAVAAEGGDERAVKVWYVGPQGWELLTPIDRGAWWVEVELDRPTALGAGMVR